MTFSSILYHDEDYGRWLASLHTERPSFFKDLNLSAVVDRLLKGKTAYALEPFFYTPLDIAEGIRYRQEVTEDLGEEHLFRLIDTFAGAFDQLRGRLAGAAESAYPLQKDRLFLDAACTYCDAVGTLARELNDCPLTAAGLLAFREYLQEYLRSEDFISFYDQTQALQGELDRVRYEVDTQGFTVSVLSDPEKPGYLGDVRALFRRFEEETEKSYLASFNDSLQLNHVEARILEGVAGLYPELFARIHTFCETHPDFRDERIVRFDREIQFYVAYLESTQALKTAGLSFCRPDLAVEDKAVHSEGGFDLALAFSVVDAGHKVVENDFSLKGEERVIVVTGPNQGGKTTFARMFGQLHFLASLGLPVPGRSARLYLCDRIFTHFEKQEDVATHLSKFEEDVVRIKQIIDAATPRSIVIMNEILSSTSMQDALALSRKILKKIDALDLLCVWVTFLDELLGVSHKTVSMASTVDEQNAARRTFRVIRKPADGLAYALSIAEKYHLTYTDMKKRLRR